MWLIIYWLIGLPSLLFHGLISVTVLISLICYKIYNSSATATTATTKSLSAHCRKQVALGQEQFTIRLRSVMMEASRRVRGATTQEQPLKSTKNNNHPTKNGQVALLALACMIGVWLSCCPAPANCLEQDAQILAPVASLAKAIIKTATLGVPLEVDFNPSGLVKNFAYFTWRTGFPVTMPAGFMQKAQDFYNRIRTRVNQAQVKDVERKSLVNLRTDLDQIVDALVEQVRHSPDGLYTDYLQTRVGVDAGSGSAGGGLPLEDACTQVGIQFKAYGVDLTNYRNIAGAVLGIPVMPTVASAMVDVAGFAKPNLSRLTNFTQQHLPLNPNFLAQLPQSVVSASGQVFSPIDNLARQLTSAASSPTRMVSPLGSIFNQAFSARGANQASLDGSVPQMMPPQPAY